MELNRKSQHGTGVRQLWERIQNRAGKKSNRARKRLEKKFTNRQNVTTKCRKSITRTANYYVLYCILSTCQFVGRIQMQVNSLPNNVCNIACRAQHFPCDWILRRKNNSRLSRPERRAASGRRDPIISLAPVVYSQFSQHLTCWTMHSLIADEELSWNFPMGRFQ